MSGILVQLLSPVWLWESHPTPSELYFSALKEQSYLGQNYHLCIYHCPPLLPGLAAWSHPPASLISRHFLVTKFAWMEYTETVCLFSLVQLHPDSAFCWLTTWTQTVLNMYIKTNQVQDMEKQEGSEPGPWRLFPVLPNELKCFFVSEK